MNLTESAVAAYSKQQAARLNVGCIWCCCRCCYFAIKVGGLESTIIRLMNVTWATHLNWIKNTESDAILGCSRVAFKIYIRCENVHLFWRRYIYIYILGVNRDILKMVSWSIARLEWCCVYSALFVTDIYAGNISTTLWIYYRTSNHLRYMRDPNGLLHKRSLLQFFGVTGIR